MVVKMVPIFFSNGRKYPQKHTPATSPVFLISDHMNTKIRCPTQPSKMPSSRNFHRDVCR